MTFASIEDLRQAARRRLPRAIFDFIDGGAQDEVTLRHNIEDFRRLSLLPRVLTDVASRDQSVTVLGQRYDSPLILAPTGVPGVVWPNGAIEAALAAGSAGVGFCLSTMSTSSIEDDRQGLAAADLVSALRDARPRSGEVDDASARRRRAAVRW